MDDKKIYWRINEKILKVVTMPEKFLEEAVYLCLRFETQCMDLAFCFAFDNAGNSIPANMAIMAMTTSNSIRVKPLRLLLDTAFIMLLLVGICSDPTNFVI